MVIIGFQVQNFLPPPLKMLMVTSSALQYCFIAWIYTSLDNPIRSGCFVFWFVCFSDPKGKFPEANCLILPLIKLDVIIIGSALFQNFGSTLVWINMLVSFSPSNLSLGVNTDGMSHLLIGESDQEPTGFTGIFYQVQLIMQLKSMNPFIFLFFLKESIYFKNLLRWMIKGQRLKGHTSWNTWCVVMWATVTQLQKIFQQILMGKAVEWDVCVRIIGFKCSPITTRPCGSSTLED